MRARRARGRAAHARADRAAANWKTGAPGSARGQPALSDALAQALRHLQSLVARATSPEDPELQAALRADPFTHGEAASGPSSDELGHVRVELAQPTTVAQLEAHFGPAQRLPRGPSPSLPRRVLFVETLPPEGTVGGTILAELDDADQVVRVLIRRDLF